MYVSAVVKISGVRMYVPMRHTDWYVRVYYITPLMYLHIRIHFDVLTLKSLVSIHWYSKTPILVISKVEFTPF